VFADHVVGRAESWVRLVDIWWAHGRLVNGLQFGVLGATIGSFWVGSAGIMCCGCLHLVCC